VSESATAFDAQRFVASLPFRPGVYRMYDASGELIYVGKAARLRDRVGSYFSSRPQSPKVAAMLKRVARVEVTVVGSETDALLLECNLIKTHRPRYNVILRDDKSFPYLQCPMDHDFPRLQFWRGLRRPAGAKIYGPFPNATVVRQVLQQLQKVFLIRNCRDGFFANRTRPCLQHQIGRCSAPCVGLISKEDYRRDLDGALRVLDGGSTGLRAELEKRMADAAATLQYEVAARLRDQLAGLAELQNQQIANAPRTRDVDVVALLGEPGQYAVSLLTVREGRSLGTTNFFPTAMGEPADTLVFCSAEGAPLSPVTRSRDWRRTTKAKGRIQQANRLMGELDDLRTRNNQTQAVGVDFVGTNRQTRKLIVADRVGKSLGGRLH